MINRLLGRFDAWYYARLAWSVWTGYLRVLTGRYGTTGHTRCSIDTLRIAEDCGGRIFITGAARLARHPGPVVFIANHMSMLETLILPYMLIAYNPTGLINVVKESLLRYPVFGKLLRSTFPIGVGRQNARNDLLEILNQGVAALQGGKSMLVFPQSTRRMDLNAEDFNSIGVKLAKRANVPLVPVALKTDFQGVGGLLRDFGAIRRDRPIRIEFGDPVMISGLGREEHAQTVQFIVEKVRTWQKQDPT
jgi:1-acyl-sn-glycerol-3-phosphate acyltransferase